MVSESEGWTRVPAISGIETLLTVPREALFNAICIVFFYAGTVPRVFVSAV